jgi:tetratricopeptide (TPR) repeat protein
MNQPQPPAELDPGGRSISAGGDIGGIASTGDQAVNVQNRAEHMTVLPAEAFAPVAELTVPPGLANLPAREALFVGRASELSRLDEAMAAPVRVVAVHGLGGIGKSTLAAHWTATRAADYILTWWITADTSAGLDAGLAGLAVALQPALSGVLPSELLRERAVQWLAGHESWLLVLDNVTDPVDIGLLLARASAGRYLITSRRATGWHNIAVPVHLDVLSNGEAVDLLTRILDHDVPRDMDGAAELGAELGCLPLAVEQAGAYLTETGITPREYLQLLSRYPAAMYQATAEGGDAARTIARIWHVTLDRLADTPLAGQVLRILAWYAPDAIPRDLLDGLADPPALLKAIGRLTAYSMLTANAGTLAAHRLVQAVSRTPEPGDTHRDPQAVEDAAGQAARQLAAALPGLVDPAGWPRWRTLLPHIEALTSYVKPEFDTETTAYLLDRAGAFLDSQGQVTRAPEYLQRACAARTRILDEDHPDTLASSNNLANAYRTAGNLGLAIPLFKQALAGRQRVLGEDHPDTLGSRNNLAYAHRVAGNLGRAISLYEQTLVASLRILGEDHPNTLNFRSNLASAYQAAGNPGRAIPLFGQALAASVLILGEEHPQTLTFQNNLAGAYQAAGDPGRAIPLFEQTLAIQQHVLGEEHLQTLTTGSNLASAYQAAGKLAKAVPMFEQTLAASVLILGEEHPQILTFQNNLAGAHQASGDLGRAIPLFEQTLAASLRVLGSDHPRTRRVRANLATARRQHEQGKRGR